MFIWIKAFYKMLEQTYAKPLSERADWLVWMRKIKDLLDKGAL